MTLTGTFVRNGYIESAREAVECGVHSGFPLCCIAWYAGPWRRFMARDGIALMDIYHWWRWKVDAGYVQCPVCKVRRSTPVEVSDCPDSCYSWKVRERLGYYDDDDLNELVEAPA